MHVMAPRRTDRTCLPARLSEFDWHARVEAVEVELRLAVGGCAGAGPRPRLRCHAAVDAGHRELALELLPAPQPDEVVAVRLEEVEVVAEVEPLRLGRAFEPEAQAIVQVVVDMRASQVDQPVFT